MKTAHLLSLVGLAVALVAPARAQVVLNDFSAFVQPDQTYFAGGWSAGDDVSPSTSFVQGATGYSIVDATNLDTAYVDFYFAGTLDLTGCDRLSLTAQLLSGNTAGTLTISLLDSAQNVATATFDLTSYTLASGATTTAAFTASDGFSLSDVTGFRITGGSLADSALVSVTLDNLSAVSASAVPEPSTYAALAGVVALAGAAFRRRRARGRA
jgi:hypothetical protein